LRPTGLADGLAPEERRYHRDNPADSPLEETLSTLLERFPRSPPAWRTAIGDSAGCMTASTIYTQAAGLPRGPPVISTLVRPAAGGRSCFVMKTFVATPLTRERNWLVVDATGRTLGRLATQVADALRGKRKPAYTPHVDTGDFVIVVNAEKISVSGKKLEEKRYYRHSGYPGGLRSRSLGEMLERRPEEVIRHAVKGMLPRTRLGRAQLRKLKVYAGPDHPHAAQKPEPMEVEA
jgi:large subunit ribosomal protein L13